MNKGNHTEAQDQAAVNLGKGLSVVGSLLRLISQSSDAGQTAVIDATLAAAMGATACPEQFRARLEQIKAALG